MQHFCPPVGRVFAALEQPLGLQQIDEPNQRGPFNAHLLGQHTLSSAFPATRENYQREGRGFRQAVGRKGLIRLATPQPPNPRDQEADFGMNALLGWSHVKLDSILIIRIQLY